MKKNGLFIFLPIFISIFGCIYFRYLKNHRAHDSVPTNWVRPTKIIPKAPPVALSFQETLKMSAGRESKLVPPRENIPKAPPISLGVPVNQSNGQDHVSKLVPPRKDLPPAPPLPILPSH